MHYRAIMCLRLATTPLFALSAMLLATQFHSSGAISCTKHGQVRVPCQDELLLDRSERFLLTLFGHSCYTMSIASTEPLEVFFYDPRGLQSGQDGPDLPERRRRLGEPPLDASGDASATLGNGHLCHNMRTCDQLKQGLSRSALYNLVISRSRNSGTNSTSDDAEKESATSVFIELEHCDPVSPWHYAGLLFVGSIGFTSMLLLLCLVAEFVLGLRMFPKVRKDTGPGQFVELPQIDLLKESGNCEAPEETAAMVAKLPAISAAADPE